MPAVLVIGVTNIAMLNFIFDEWQDIYVDENITSLACRQTASSCCDLLLKVCVRLRYLSMSTSVSCLMSAVLSVPTRFDSVDVICFNWSTTTLWSANWHSCTCSHHVAPSFLLTRTITMTIQAKCNKYRRAVQQSTVTVASNKYKWKWLDRHDYRSSASSTM